MCAMIPMILALGFAGCAPNPPPAPFSTLPTVAYSNCGNMAALRNNLTDEPYPSPESDALLEALGVRCLGSAESTVRTRY